MKIVCENCCTMPPQTRPTMPNNVIIMRDNFSARPCPSKSYIVSIAAIKNKQTLKQFTIELTVKLDDVDISHQLECEELKSEKLTATYHMRWKHIGKSHFYQKILFFASPDRIKLMFLPETAPQQKKFQCKTAMNDRRMRSKHVSSMVVSMLIHEYVVSYFDLT